MNDNPYQTPQVPAEQTTASEPKRHSRIGIASFICAVSAVLLVFSPMIAVPALEVAAPGMLDKNPSAVSIVALVAIAGFLAALVAIGLGTAALFQHSQRRVLPVVGIVIGFTVFGFWLIMAIFFLAHRSGVQDLANQVLPASAVPS